MAQLVLLVLLSATWKFPPRDAALMTRILPVTGADLRCVVVYSRYASGRPRLVVAGTDEGHFDTPGDLLLIRLADTDRDPGRVVDRLPLSEGVMELALVRAVDAKDIGVELHLVHPPQGITVRVLHGKLTQIADTLPQAVVDLDRDGVPEIVTGFLQGAGRCGARGHPSIYRWKGRRYARDDDRYAAFAVARAGGGMEELEFEEGPESESQHGRGYSLRVHRQPGVARVVVRLDGKRVVPGVPFRIEGECHRMTAEATGRKGAEAWVFLVRPEPRKRSGG